MAILSDTARFETWQIYMQEVPRGEQYTITKVDLRAALNAIDTWLSDNAAALNAAIPQPARGAMSTAEKARLTQYVISKRYLVGV